MCFRVVVDVHADVVVVVVRRDDLACGRAVGQQFEEPCASVRAVAGHAVLREDDPAVALAGHRDVVALGFQLADPGHDLRGADGRELKRRSSAIADVHEALADVHRGHCGVAGVELGLRKRRERGVALDVLAGLVDEDGTVGVAVVGDPHVGVGRAHECAEVAEVFAHRLGLPAGEVAVRLGVHGDDVTPEFAVERRAGERARTVARVQGDRQVGGRDRRPVDGVGQLCAVVAARGRHLPVGSHTVPGGVVELLGGERALHALQVGNRQLDAVAADELDAVVLAGVVTRGHHHRRDAGALRVRLRGRRRNHPEPVDVHADALEARDGRVFEHAAGGSGVPCDRDAVGAPHRAGRLRDAQHEPRCELLVGHAPRSARPEDVHASSCVRPPLIASERVTFTGNSGSPTFPSSSSTRTSTTSVVSW